uniref:FHA domain-containing protein n=1 Tax=Steinernema glaseri TaxID=37863 RepID=A0A1I7Y3G9_9BILA
MRYYLQKNALLCTCSTVDAAPSSHIPKPVAQQLTLTEYHCPILKVSHHDCPQRHRDSSHFLTSSSDFSQPSPLQDEDDSWEGKSELTARRPLRCRVSRRHFAVYFDKENIKDKVDGSCADDPSSTCMMFLYAFPFTPIVGLLAVPPFQLQPESANVLLISSASKSRSSIDKCK